MSTPIASKMGSLSQRQTASTLSAQSPASVHLDAVRGMAALLVFVSHWRALFFADYPQLQHPNAPIKLLYALTGLGHSAVMIFFVLSGYFISSSVFRSRERGRWSWTWYAEQRLTRLYVVLIPALVLGAAWDYAGSHLLRGTPVYSASPDYQIMLKHPVSQMLTARSWLANLFFLQGIRSPVFGSNGPLWSLANEFWYYALFPIGLLALSRKSAVPARAGYALAGLLILLFVGKEIALYFLVWLLGTLVCFLRPSRLTTTRGGGVVLGLIFLASFLAPRFKLISDPLLADFLASATFSVLLYFILNHAHRSPSVTYAKAARALSNVSYSLYLIHVPVLIFLNACIIGHGSRWQPTPGRLAEGLVVAGVVFLYTFGIWSVTEARTGQIRGKISAWLSRNGQTVRVE